MQHFSIHKKLHTDVLEETYGPIHSEVIRHDSFMREVFLCDESGTARTYAITIFSFDKNDREIAAIDTLIKNGGLIGKTFREHGYYVRKNVTSVFVLDNPDWLSKKFKTESLTSKARTSEFYAKRPYSGAVVYGTVLEVYSPDFRKPEVNEYDLDQIHPSTSTLLQAGFTHDEIYHALGEEGKDHFNQEELRFQAALDFMQVMPEQNNYDRFLQYITNRKPIA